MPATPPPAPFEGFPPETFAFLADLGANNRKDWFEANRARYDEFILAPGLALINALAEPLATLAPGYRAEARLNGSFRRINRDTRFSKDKTPYNPRLHLVFWTGEHPLRSPAIHLVLHADRFGYGAGEWAWDAARLERFREQVQAPGPRAALEAAIESAASVGCRLPEPELKRPPRGVDADHPQAAWLRRKTLVVRNRESLPLPASAGSPGFVADCLAVCTALSPVNGWLRTNLS